MAKGALMLGRVVLDRSIVVDRTHVNVLSFGSFGLEALRVVNERVPLTPLVDTHLFTGTFFGITCLQQWVTELVATDVHAFVVATSLFLAATCRPALAGTFSATVLFIALGVDVGRVAWTVIGTHLS